MLLEDLITYSNQLILEQSESELIEEARKDPAKFRPLYNKYFHRIFLFVYHRVGDKENAADITSQVFLQALLKIKDFVYKGLPLSAWLYRIAINECNQFFRASQQQRLVILDHQTINHLAEEIGEHYPEDLNFEGLKKVVQKLNPDEIQLLQMRFFESMAFKQIADILAITENNAKVKLYRVLDKLRIKMGLK